MNFGDIAKRHLSTLSKIRTKEDKKSAFINSRRQNVALFEGKRFSTVMKFSVKK